MTQSRLAGMSLAAAVIGTLAVSVGGFGVAVAANGGSLTLGQSNSATSVTTLSNRDGTPLALKAGHDEPPLKVNSTTVVPHLDAGLVGGSTAGSLRTSGSAAATHYRGVNGGIVNPTGSQVAATAKLAAGVYYVTADAFVLIPPAAAVNCDLSTKNLTNAYDDNTGVGVGGAAPADDGSFQTLTQTEGIVVKAGQRVGFYCRVLDTADGTELFQSGITAIRVDRSSAGQVQPGRVFAIRSRHAR